MLPAKELLVMVVALVLLHHPTCVTSQTLGLDIDPSPASLVGHSPCTTSQLQFCN